MAVDALPARRAFRVEPPASRGQVVTRTVLVALLAVAAAAIAATTPVRDPAPRQ